MGGKREEERGGGENIEVGLLNLRKDVPEINCTDSRILAIQGGAHRTESRNSVSKGQKKKHSRRNSGGR